MAFLFTLSTNGIDTDNRVVFMVFLKKNKSYNNSHIIILEIHKLN